MIRKIKSIIIFFLLGILIIPVFAEPVATGGGTTEGTASNFVEGHGSDVHGKNLSFGVNVNLTGLAVQDIGFSSGKVENFADKPVNIQSSILTYDNASNSFVSSDIYVYWKIIKGNVGFPTIELIIQGPLVGKNIKNKRDWSLEWRYVDSPVADPKKVLQSNGETTATIFPKITDSDPGSAAGIEGVTPIANTLEKGFGAIIVNAKVDATEYWAKASGTYTADIILKVSSQ